MQYIQQHKNPGTSEFKKQLLWAVVSIPIVVIVMFVDYNTLAKSASFLYIIFVILLTGVLFTKPINGARSWYVITQNLRFQPSELAKVVVIVFLSTMIVKIQKDNKNDINKFYKLLIVLFLAAIPLVLILLQPDYGTAMAFVVAITLMLFASGINKKYIIGLFLLIAILAPIMYIYVLPEHAKSRIEVFMHPELDPRGAGYNIIQSKLAIGAGKLFGMGILRGNQTQMGYLYPKTTDFIFSVIWEEMGFIISSIVIILYIVMITKAIYVAKTAKNDLGSYIAIGISRNISISYGRKHRNDHGTFANNRCSITICELWRKFNGNKLYMYSTFIKHKWKATKNNIYELRYDIGDV